MFTGFIHQDSLGKQNWARECRMGGSEHMRFINSSFHCLQLTSLPSFSLCPDFPNFLIRGKKKKILQLYIKYFCKRQLILFLE